MHLPNPFHILFSKQDGLFLIMRWINRHILPPPPNRIIDRHARILNAHFRGRLRIELFPRSSSVGLTSFGSILLSCVHLVMETYDLDDLCKEYVLPFSFSKFLRCAIQVHED